MANICRESVSIRSATLEDMRYIAELKIESHYDIEKHNIISHVLNALFVREYKKRWQRKFRDGVTTLLLCLDNNVIGFISYTPKHRGGNFSGSTAEISHIYLKPELRGRKLGRFLLGTTLNIIRQKKFTRVIVWLDENRIQTRRFYEAMGFKITSSRRVDILDENATLSEVMYELNH